MAIDPIVLKEKIMEHLTLVVMNSADENIAVKSAMAGIPDPVEGQTQEDFSDAIWGALITARNNHWVSNEDMWLAISEGIAEALDASGGVGSQYLKAPVRLVAVENVTARQGLLQIDGQTLVSGDRVLLTSQNDSRQNGIYVAAPGAWVRSDDCNEAGELLDGALTLVEEGTDHANTLWAVVTEDPIVPGSDPVTFVELIGTGTGPEGPPGPPGMYWRGTWSSSIVYAVTDAVQYEGSSYISKISNNQNYQPDVSPSSWSLLAEKGSPGEAGPPGSPGPQGSQGDRGLTGPMAIDMDDYIPGALVDMHWHGIVHRSGIVSAASAFLETGPVETMTLTFAFAGVTKLTFTWTAGVTTATVEGVPFSVTENDLVTATLSGSSGASGLVYRLTGATS